MNRLNGNENVLLQWLSAYCSDGIKSIAAFMGMAAIAWYDRNQLLSQSEEKGLSFFLPIFMVNFKRFGILIDNHGTRHPSSSTASTNTLAVPLS
jgi:hypothetical protein